MEPPRDNSPDLKVAFLTGKKTFYMSGLTVLIMQLYVK